MAHIFEATEKDIVVIKKLAYQIWPQVYQTIISESQISYMLDLFYSESALLNNITKQNHHFYIIESDGQPRGFAAFQHNYQQENITRLHKLYVLPELHGQGLGKQLLHAVIQNAKLQTSDAISLNVNKFNSAISFYKKLGFEIVGEEELPIGNGFFMDDYKMEFKFIIS